MKRTGHVPFMNLKLGIFVVLASALLLWATFQSGSFRLGREEMIVVHFAGVGGLEEGAVVRLNGVPVGIVRDISAVLARHGVSIEVLETECESASMSGEPLFRARAELGVPAALSLELLRGDLEALANELMVDLALNEAGAAAGA